MGAKTYSVIAMAVLGWSTVVGAQTPKPGKLETYRDWTIGCDNRNRCDAVSLLAEDGDIPDTPMMVGVARNAGADATAEIWVVHDAKGRAQVDVHVDGRKVASIPSLNGDGMLIGPQASALAIAMARGTTMDVRVGGKVIGRPSLAGSGAALRYMDARQGRAGTTTALIATGPLGPTAVRPAPPAPTIRRALIPAGAVPPSLWREELTALGKFTGCTDEMKDGQPLELHRLSKSETLILVPCGSGAYNFSSVPVIATGTAGRRVFRFATFDYQPSWTEEASHPMLVNVGWSPETSRLDSFAKGRGIGDCGNSETYVWDGVRFRLAEASAMDECRGAWHWITTWTARVTP
ncbi:MAG: DUF1176 domain-containing protein [bacterium]|nr:DUF1176 domain-containing protein [bacterium]